MKSNNNRIPIFSVQDLALAILGLVFCMTFFVIPTIEDSQKASVIEAVISGKPNPFDSVEIEAKAAYVLDVSSGNMLYEKNSEAALPLASLTKIMTAVAALQAVPESTVINIDSEDLELEGDSGLYVNEKWRLDDLLGLVLIESSNDGAYAIASSVGSVEAATSVKSEAREAFVGLMNATARNLGLSQTVYFNSTGLDRSVGEAGAYGSAKDMAKLLSYAVTNYGDLFRRTKYSSLKLTSLSELQHTATNTNKGLDSIPVVIASKTGFTDLAGGNLAVVFDAGIGRHIAVVVLQSTQAGRFEDVYKLSWAAIDYLSIVSNAQ